jgi:hypothetical protein
VIARFTGVRVDQAKLQAAIDKALDSPKARAKLARIANDESRKMVVIAEQVAEEELHRRPDNRRTAESLAHGKEYHDSFEVIPADVSNPSKVRAGITNRHPMARLIEHGSRRHPITPRGNYKLAFPSEGGANQTGGIVPVPGKHPNFRQGIRGEFPIEITSENITFRSMVDHPGTAPKRILQRVADRYRKSTRHNVKAKSTL